MAERFWSTNKTGTLALCSDVKPPLRHKTSPLWRLSPALGPAHPFDLWPCGRGEAWASPPADPWWWTAWRWRKACVVNCPAKDGGSQHVRHAAFGSNVSAVIQVTSQLGSWVVVAPYASVTNENSIIRKNKSKKSGKYIFWPINKATTSMDV